MPGINNVFALSSSRITGCHLKAICGVGCTLSVPALRKAFEAELNKPTPDNWNYYTGVIVSIADSSRYSTEPVLLELGFKLLGIQPGAHGVYKMLLYGKGFTLPGEVG